MKKLHDLAGVADGDDGPYTQRILFYEKDGVCYLEVIAGYGNSQYHDSCRYKLDGKPNFNENKTLQLLDDEVWLDPLSDQSPSFKRWFGCTGVLIEAPPED